MVIVLFTNYCVLSHLFLSCTFCTTKLIVHKSKAASRNWCGSDKMRFIDTEHTLDIKIWFVQAWFTIVYRKPNFIWPHLSWFNTLQSTEFDIILKISDGDWVFSQQGLGGRDHFTDKTEISSLEILNLDDISGILHDWPWVASPHMNQ